MAGLHRAISRAQRIIRPHPYREDSQCDAQNADDAALAEAIIAMARTLGLTVTAEQLFETLYRNAKIS